MSTEKKEALTRAKYLNSAIFLTFFSVDVSIRVRSQNFFSWCILGLNYISQLLITSIHSGNTKKSTQPTIYWFSLNAVYTFPAASFSTRSSPLCIPISYQIRSSVRHTVSHASKQTLRKEGQNSYYFLRSMCHVVNGRWVEVKSRSIFVFPFSVSITLSKEAHVNWPRKKRWKTIMGAMRLREMSLLLDL